VGFKYAIIFFLFFILSIVIAGFRIRYFTYSFYDKSKEEKEILKKSSKFQIIILILFVLLALIIKYHFKLV